MLRAVLTVNMVALNLFRYDNFSRPQLGMAVVVALVCWTGIAIWAYAAPRRRTPLLLGVDLAVAVLALVVTLVVKGDWFNASVPGFWVAGALLAWAIHGRWIGGLVAAAVVSGTDLLIRDSITQTNYANVFLLMIAGPIVGYLCGSLQQMAASRAVAERAAAAAAERARLARAVHDGVLQVLALVQRRGRDLGGEAGELGRLAGEQEAALRSLIRQQDVVDAPPMASPDADGTPPTARADLARSVEELATRSGAAVTVVTPGHAVAVSRTVHDELLDVLAECLRNVERHVGAGAAAWVVLEELPGAVVLSVRDEGPGIADGRLAEAVGQGRLGVDSSIRGRLADLGGTAVLTTAPGQGVEWEFTVPLPGAPS